MTNSPQQDATLAALQGTFDADNSALAVTKSALDLASTNLSACLHDKDVIQAAFDAYKLSHPDTTPPPPPPPPTGFHIGIDVAANDVRTNPATGQRYTKAELYALVKSKTGSLGGRIKFFADTLDGAEQNRVSTKATEPEPVLCWKAQLNQANIVAAADRATSRTWWVYWQEFQRAILTGALSWDTYNKQFANVNLWLKGHPNRKNIVLFSDGSGFAERTNAAQLNTVVNLDFSQLDAVGLDIYSDDSRAAPWAPADIFADLLRIHAAGKKVKPAMLAHVGELGVARKVTKNGVVSLLDPVVRRDVIASYYAYLKSNGVSGGNYWAVNNEGPGNADWSIDLSVDKVVADWFKANVAA